MLPQRDVLPAPVAEAPAGPRYGWVAMTALLGAGIIAGVILIRRRRGT